MRRAILILAACSEPPVASHQALLSAPSGASCISPLDLGATCDDSRDDRDALQLAIDHASAVGLPLCLPACTLHVARRTEGTDKHRTLRISRPLVMVGSGSGISTLGMLGSGIAPGGSTPGDWWLLDVTGGPHVFSGFTLTGAERYDTGEQTHLVNVSGPARDISVVDVEVVLPKLNKPEGGTGFYNAGDCLRFVGGAPPAFVDGVTLDRVRAPECDRSAIGIQRGVQNLWVTHFRSDVIGDQAFDMEPSNNGPIGPIVVRDSVLHTGRGRGIAVTLTGNDEPARGILFERVDIDGSIFAQTVEDTHLRSVRIWTDGTDNIAPIAVSKRGTGFVMEDVTVERAGGKGPVVSFNSHAGSWPSDAAIIRGRIIQRGEGPVISGEPVSGLLVDGTNIDCAGPVAGYNAVQFSKAGTTADLARMRVVNSTIVGNCKFAVQVGAGADSVIVTGNVFAGADLVRFVGPPRLPAVVAGNVMEQ